jgi:hypothetical protein
MATLRDFWFPVALFLSSICFAAAGMFSANLWRRNMIFLSVILFIVGAAAFIYGDPVRGPFTHLVHPHAKGTVTFHAGIAQTISTKQLSDGYDFSKFITFEGFTDPLQLRVQRTWPFSWRVTLRLVQDNTAILDVENNEVRHIDSHLDMNYDDKALEVMGEGRPIVQIIASDDYDIYVNAVILTSHSPQPEKVLVLNGTTFRIDHVENMKDSDFPQRIFKYPAYSRQGERD